MAPENAVVVAAAPQDPTWFIVVIKIFALLAFIYFALFVFSILFACFCEGCIRLICKFSHWGRRGVEAEEAEEQELSQFRRIVWRPGGNGQEGRETSTTSRPPKYDPPPTYESAIALLTNAQSENK